MEGEKKDLDSVMQRKNKGTTDKILWLAKQNYNTYLPTQEVWKCRGQSHTHQRHLRCASVSHTHFTLACHIHKPTGIKTHVYSLIP